MSPSETSQDPFSKRVKLIKLMRTYRNVRNFNLIRILYERILYALCLYYTGKFNRVKKKNSVEITGGFAYTE